MNGQEVRVFSSHVPVEPPAAPVFVSFDRIMSFLVTQAYVIMLPVALAVTAAHVYLAWTTPIYTARTQLIIDPRLPQFIPGKQTDEVLSWDTAQVESEIAVLQSEHIAGLVVSHLKLDHDPDFHFLPSALGKLMALANESSSDRQMEPDRVRQAIDTIGQGLSVKRVGLSYAIDISFGFPDPLRAKEVANAIALTYIADQLQIKSDAARQGGDWLQERMVGLRRQMNAASRAVQAFRASHRYDIPRSPTLDVGSARTESARDPTPAPDAETLDELDASYSMYRRVYEAFLQSFTEAAQRQSFPVSEAHVLAEASLPQSPSSPRSKLIYPLAVLIGGLTGFGIALVRNAMDRTLHTPDQVRLHLNLTCLGVLPRMRRRRVSEALRRVTRLGAARAGRSRASVQPEVIGRRHWWSLRRARYFGSVLGDADTPFAKGMVTVQVCLESARSPGRMGAIGVLAPHRRDGTSTVASNLAVLLADMGVRTLLIDADCEGRSLTNHLRGRNMPGLTDVLAKVMNLEDAVVRIHENGLSVLPAGLHAPVGPTHLGVYKKQFKDLLNTAAETYEAVIIDLPPALPLAGALSVSALLDGLVLVVRAGGATRDTLSDLVDHLDRGRARLLGFVLARCNRQSAVG